MAQGPGQFTRDQVLAAERPAWAQSDGSAYYYDGIYIWVADDHREHIVPSKNAPEQGWRHRPTCSCELCRSV